MKKTLALALALALILTLGVTAGAENSTGGSTLLSYTVETNYTVTIPSSVTLEASTGTITGDFSVGANSLIPADQQLVMKITAATNYDTTLSVFRLKNGVGTNVYLPYSIKKDLDAVVMDTPFLTVNAGEAYAGASVTLSFVADTPESAGTYTDTLTISVSLENIT